MKMNEKIRRFIEKNLVVFGDEAQFGDLDNIFEMGMVNSLFAMKLLNYIQKEFGIEVDTDDLEIDNFSSVNNIMRFIEDRREHRFIETSREQVEYSM